MKKVIKYDKLVRDNIPKIINDKGKECKYHIESGLDYRKRLFDKMIEELEEFKIDSNIEEAADMLAVFRALIKCHNIQLMDVIYAEGKKLEERGAFTKGIILDEVIEKG